MSNFFELVEKRESCRNYSDKPVTKEQLIKCISAARLAPSACNSQPWSFIVVNNRKKAVELAKCTQSMGMNKFTDNAPAFIVITEEKANLSATVGAKFKKQEYAQMDIGIATAHICYSATEQGLSTCIIGWFNEKSVKELLNIHEDKRVRLIISIGYANYQNLRNKSRKNLDDIMQYLE